MSKEEYKKHVPIDHSEDLPMKYIQNAAKGILPDTFDHDHIKKELAKIQNNPSLVASYITALRATFKVTEQIKVINAMERLNTAVAGGMRSQIEMKKLEHEYKLALNDLETVDDDLTIQKLEKEDKQLDYKISIAQKKQTIENLKKPPEQPETKAEERAKKLKDQAERQKHDIEKDILEKKKTIVTWQRIDEEKEQAKEAALQVLLKKFVVSSVENLPPEGLRGLAKQYESIEDLFENMKAEG
ncbi:MAG TPA: hypothetical protein VMW42_01490 [Desulfatiglandales bacterium]|nr:hypothetical protein [Desulfatiglandales bacterium]